jgi:hypothetical protein
MYSSSLNEHLFLRNLVDSLNCLCGGGGVKLINSNLCRNDDINVQHTTWPSCEILDSPLFCWLKTKKLRLYRDFGWIVTLKIAHDVLPQLIFFKLAQMLLMRSFTKIPHFVLIWHKFNCHGKFLLLIGWDFWNVLRNYDPKLFVFHRTNMWNTP